MLHNEARELLVEGYIKTHNVKVIAEVFSVSDPTVYRLAQQKRETGTVALRVSERGRKRILNRDDMKRIDEAIREQPDITIHELTEKLQLHASEETVRRAVVEMGYRFRLPTGLPWLVFFDWLFLLILWSALDKWAAMFRSALILTYFV